MQQWKTCNLTISVKWEKSLYDLHVSIAKKTIKNCHIANKRNWILRETTGRYAKTIILPIQKNLLGTTNFLRKMHFFVKIKKNLLGLRSEKFRPGCQNYIKKVQRKFFQWSTFLWKSESRLLFVRLSKKIWKSESKHRQNCPKTHSTSSEEFPRVPKKKREDVHSSEKEVLDKKQRSDWFFSFLIYYHGKMYMGRLIVSLFLLYFCLSLDEGWKKCCWKIVHKEIDKSGRYCGLSDSLGLVLNNPSREWDQIVVSSH